MGPGHDPRHRRRSATNPPRCNGRRDLRRRRRWPPMDAVATDAIEASRTAAPRPGLSSRDAVAYAAEAAVQAAADVPEDSQGPNPQCCLGGNLPDSPGRSVKQPAGRSIHACQRPRSPGAPSPGLLRNFRLQTCWNRKSVPVLMNILAGILETKSRFRPVHETSPGACRHRTMPCRHGEALGRFRPARQQDLDRGTLEPGQLQSRPRLCDKI